MGGGALIGGLIEGYAGQMLKKRDLEHQEEQQDRRNRIDYLKAAIASGQLKTDAMNAAVDELGEITGEGGGGKKGKSSGTDILKRLLGKFTPQQQPVPFEQRVAGEGGSRAPGLGEVPARMTGPSGETAPGGNVDTSALGFGRLPTRPKVQINKTTQDIQDEEIAFEKRRQKEVTGPAEEEQFNRQAALEQIRAALAEALASYNKAAADARQELQLANQRALETTKSNVQIKLEQMRDAKDLMVAGSKERIQLERDAKKDMAKTIDDSIRQMSTALASARGKLKTATTQNENLKKAQEKWAADHGIQNLFGRSMGGEPQDVTEANATIDNTDRALKYLTANRSRALESEAAMNEVLAKADDFMAGTVPTQKRSELVKQFPTATTEQIDKVLNELKAQGYEVIND